MNEGRKIEASEPVMLVLIWWAEQHSVYGDERVKLPSWT